MAVFVFLGFFGFLVFPLSRASHGLIGFVGGWREKGWQWLGGSGTNGWGIVLRSFWWWFGWMRMSIERDMIGLSFLFFFGAAGVPVVARKPRADRLCGWLAGKRVAVAGWQWWQSMGNCIAVILVVVWLDEDEY
jgi:hypothetical protein